MFCFLFKRKRYPPPTSFHPPSPVTTANHTFLPFPQTIHPAHRTARGKGVEAAMQLKLLDPLLLGAAYLLVKRHARTGGVLRVTALVALLGTARRLIAGLHARRVRRLAGESDLRILIVGSGFSGLAMALKCKQLGLPFTILDSGADVGGTWRDNTYPGCGCDVVTPLYSLAGEQDFKFSGSWASASECLAYVKHIVEKHGLQRHIRQRCAVSRCEWDAAARRWTVAFTNEEGKEETQTAHIVVAGCGQLRDPVGPAFDCTAFEGPVVHTARWDPTVKLANKRVACIGTGASAIQFVPAVVDSVERMFVFQRSPPHTLFKVPSVPVVGSVAQVLSNNSVLVQRCFRLVWYYFMEGFFYIFVDQYAFDALPVRGSHALLHTPSPPPHPFPHTARAGPPCVPWASVSFSQTCGARSRSQSCTTCCFPRRL